MAMDPKLDRCVRSEDLSHPYVLDKEVHIPRAGQNYPKSRRVIVSSRGTKTRTCWQIHHWGHRKNSCSIGEICLEVILSLNHYGHIYWRPESRDGHWLKEVGQLLALRKPWRKQITSQCRGIVEPKNFSVNEI